jgi:hypothetical protein
VYKIRGTDRKEYGPASSELVRQWIAQGRADAQTLTLADDDTIWKPLSSFPEFSEALRAITPPPLPASVVPKPATPAGPPTSRLALASLVLALLGWLGVTAIVGLVLGIVAWVKIERSKGRLGGRGLALAGVCLSGGMLLLSPVWLRLALPAFAHGKARTQEMRCADNLKTLALGVLVYASEHNDSLPDAASWCEAIPAHVGTPKSFVCATDKTGQRCSYGFNRRLSGFKLSKVNPRTVMIFECAGGWNASGGPKEIISRHDGIYIVGLVDGSVHEVRASNLSSSQWEPDVRGRPGPVRPR